MCGRFTLTLKADELKEELGLQEMPDDYQPRFNIAPTQPVAVLLEYPAKRLEILRWGLVPFWAKDLSEGSRMINARSETVASKPAYRRAFANRRCLILADGFYEWHKDPSKKGPSQPYYFRRTDGHLFAFAGLWEEWRPPEGEPVRTCTLMTTSANESVAPVHDRMPVILERDQWSGWIDTKSTPELLDFLRPLPAEKMESFAVKPHVNSPAFDSPVCLEPWGGA